MQLFFYGLFVFGIVAADQISKFLVVANIDLFEKVPFIPGLVRLTYTQNTGAAFSALEGMQWLFVVVFLALTAILLWEYFKGKMPFTAFERWSIVAIYGGGLGNVIDRVRLGYVVDMIETEFIEFPVFNVADCFITCGCIALLTSLILFNKKIWKDEK